MSTSLNPNPYSPTRPRRSGAAAGGAVVGGLIGLAMVANPIGAVIGGLIGGALSSDDPVPLEDALKGAFQSVGLNFVGLFREGAFKATAIFSIGNSNWNIVSQAPASDPQGRAWTNLSLEDFHYEQIVRAIPEVLRRLA